MQFPNEVQACILFDRRVSTLEKMVRTFLQVEEARTGSRFTISEAKPGVFYRLFGGGELMITLEYMDKPADMAAFQQPLSSAITGLLCPDIRKRLTKNRTHILVNVSHGVLGSVAQNPKIAEMMRTLGMPQEGHSLPQFKRRLDVLAMLARIVGDTETAQAVHWTQSNQLFAGEQFESFAKGEAPSQLHVHPYLFGDRAAGKDKAGILTFGMRHFIGREVTIEPHSLPWAAHLDTIIAFLRLATIDNGYVIPDGDTFGPEGGRTSYRVLHRAPEEGGVPLVELVPLLHRDHDFQAPDYVPRERVIDDRMPPPQLMPVDADEKQELANEWREKRALAEGAGGRFEVRARGTGEMPPHRPPLPGKRPIFGRKKPG